MKKIITFLSIEFLLVALLSIPLFVLKPQSGGNLVMVLSVIFMWLPALATLVTRKLTKDKSDLRVKPRIRENWRTYLIAAYVPGILIVLGALLYFMIFPEHLDLSLGFVKELLALAGQEVTLPSLGAGELLLISGGLILLAPLVFVNHILAFGEEVGWRAYLLPLLCEKFGVIKGILLDGVLWGIAHAPLVCFGVNYSGDYFGKPWTGILMMVVFATTVGIFLSYVTIKTKSVIPACISHGAINAIREAPLYICVPACNALLGPKPSGIIGMAGFLAAGVMILIGFWRKGDCSE